MFWRHLFQPTLPARGATEYAVQMRDFSLFQSTLPAQGATHKREKCACFCAISIHAPRTGSDSVENMGYGNTWDISIYAPRMGGDVKLKEAVAGLRDISIHAPRTGSDRAHLGRDGVRRISIHAPRTGSDVHPDGDSFRRTTFQSTLPARGATCRLRFHR